MPRIPKRFFGNWKMNGSFSFIDSYFSEFFSAVDTNVTDTICIMPPACYIDYVNSTMVGFGSNVIMAGAQDMSMTGNDIGAFTGQIGMPMYVDCGAKYVLIGQAECREYLGLTNEYLNRRIKNALQNGLKVVYCVGENLDEREAGQTESVLNTQITEGLDGLSAEQMSNIVIAYEPVWASGTGKIATPADAEAACAHIRFEIESIYGPAISQESLYVIYGGSVKPANAAELCMQENIDGLLVGGASLRPADFVGIINEGSLARR